MSTQITRVSDWGIKWWVWGIGDPAERAKIQTNVNLGKFKISRNNDNNIREFYDIGSGWIEMTTASPVIIDTSNSQGHIYFGIFSDADFPDTSASFDNFRLIWVK